MIHGSQEAHERVTSGNEQENINKHITGKNYNTIFNYSKIEDARDCSQPPCMWLLEQHR